MPYSVDEVYGYTQFNSTDDSIYVVHCYSTRNGLYGSPEEARIYWSIINFDTPDYLKYGHSENIRVSSIPIETKIQNFGVHEADLTTFLMSQNRDLQVTLHIVPGPSVRDRELRSFTFYAAQTIVFSTDQVVVLPDANKLFFYSNDWLGEISLENYPFQDMDLNPTVRFHKVHNPYHETIDDFSTESKLLQVQPLYLSNGI